MLKRISIVLAAILLIASVALVGWQGSFNTGSFVRPDDPQETFLFFGLQILIFLLMLGLGYYLARLMIKLWVAKQVDRHGSRVRTRLVMGALALSAMPVIFLVLLNYEVLGATLARVFSAPFEHVKGDFTAIGKALQDQTKQRALAEAQLIAASGETEALLKDPGSVPG